MYGGGGAAAAGQQRAAGGVQWRTQLLSRSLLGETGGGREARREGRIYSAADRGGEGEEEETSG